MFKLQDLKINIKVAVRKYRVNDLEFDWKETNQFQDRLLNVFADTMVYCKALTGLNTSFDTPTYIRLVYFIIYAWKLY